jgi:periplasmic copper chaperone A
LTRCTDNHFQHTWEKMTVNFLNTTHLQGGIWKGGRAMVHRAIGLSTAGAVALLAGAAPAQEHHRGMIEIDHAWARATPPAAKTGAAYIEIRNTGPDPDRVLAVTTPVAEKAEVHKTEREGDILRMREIFVLEVPGNDKALLQPGGLHIMLTGLKEPLRAGSEFPLTLRFEKAGPIEIEVHIERSTPSHDPSVSSHGH